MSPEIVENGAKPEEDPIAWRATALWIEEGAAETKLEELRQRAAAEYAGSPLWKDAERWIWNEILLGKAANLKMKGHPRNIDPRTIPTLEPKQEAGWNDDRVIRSAFLREILTQKPYCTLIPISGVHIVNALFRDYLDLAHIRLSYKLRLEACRFENEINLEDAKISSWLSLAKSAVVAPEGCEVRLRGAKIEEVELVDFFSTAPISMDGIAIQQHLMMRNSTFERAVDLPFAKIGLSLDLSGATFLSQLKLSAADIGELRLGTADTALPPTRWAKCTIKGEQPDALILRNTKVRAWQDGRPDGPSCAPSESRTADLVGPWPENYSLQGFTYDLLGGYVYSNAMGGGGATASKPILDMQKRSADEWIAWASRDRSLSPQPFEQIAGVLRKSGETYKADEVLYAGRQKIRRSSGMKRKLGLLLLEGTIGYGIGYRYFYVLIWVLLFTGIGTAVLHAHPPAALPCFFDKFAFSLNALLPVIKLDPSFDKVQLDSSATAYFWGQRLIGWVFGSFLIAGLAGLTQKT